MTAIGVLELNSIARGFEAADEMVKTAAVRLLFAKPVCPGKFTVVVTGEVGAVSSAMAAGRTKAGTYLVDELILANVHPAVVPAFYGVGTGRTPEALGFIETFSVASAIEAADAGVKAAEVDLIEIRLALGLGGKSFVIFTGLVADVKAAVEAGSALVAGKGYLVETVVIPAPDAQMRDLLSVLT
ncbi:MAG: BMC domain-containing protein [Firmicutes bacterium]|nr:BMC domain-containing protein [Bacillota bacterium]